MGLTKEQINSISRIVAKRINNTINKKWKEIEYEKANVIFEKFKKYQAIAHAVLKEEPDAKSISFVLEKNLITFLNEEPHNNYRHYNINRKYSVDDFFAFSGVTKSSLVNEQDIRDELTISTIEKDVNIEELIETLIKNYTDDR